MFGLRSAQSRAIAAGALGLLLLASVAAVAGMAATTDQTGRSTLWLVIGLSAAAFLVVAGAVAMVTVSVVRPLAALRASARAITTGDSQARARVSGPEEVASLARDFNAMTDALAAKAEAAQQSEARYRLLAENVTDVIWTMDTNLRFTYVSASVTRLRSYTVEEAMAQTLQECLTPASLKVAMKAVADERAIEQTEEKDLTRSRTLELEQICKDGSTVWTEVKVGLLRDQDNRPVAILGVGRDITERKRAEEERERLLHDTGERIKELACMYRVASSARARDTIEEVLQNVVAAIPPAWTYPDITRAKVSFDGREYVSEPFEETPWKQSSDIVIDGQKQGVVEVYYLEERPELDEGPFLKEERNLIDGLAHALAEAAERKRAEEALRKVREDIETRVERRMQEANGYGLTFRELTVLHLVAAGKADKEIATVLGISHLTAHKHLANILDKMGAASRTEAGVRALREGLLD